MCLAHEGPGPNPTTRKWAKHSTLHCLNGEEREKRGCSEVNNTAALTEDLGVDSSIHTAHHCHRTCVTLVIVYPIPSFSLQYTDTHSGKAPLCTHANIDTHIFFKDEENDNPMYKYENHNINKIPKLNEMGNAIGNDLPKPP